MGGNEPVVVLLVEDDADHAELVSRALSDHGDRLRLVHVTTGSAALGYLAREGAGADAVSRPRPDLVLLDLRLPGMNGGEVLRRIRASTELAGIPVVVLSTSEARSEMAEAAGDGADACAVKPIDGEAFRELVRKLVATWTAAGRRPGPDGAGADET